MEPVQGRKVSKVVKTTVVRGERVEKRTGDTSLAADLPSAREDFEKVSPSRWEVGGAPRAQEPAGVLLKPCSVCPPQALSYAGVPGAALAPRVVETETVQDDGSVLKRFSSAACCASPANAPLCPWAQQPS